MTRYIRDSTASADAALSRRNLLGQSLRALTLDLRSRTQAQEPSQDVVRRHLDALLPDFAAKLKDTMADAVATAAAKKREQAASSSTSSSSESEPDQPTEASQAPPPAADKEFVTSASARKRHIIVLGPSTSVERWLWVTACGWKFGQTSGARDPTPDDLNCPRCFCRARA